MNDTFMYIQDDLINSSRMERMNKLNDMQDLAEKWKQKKNEKGVLQLTGQQVTMILPFADCDCIVAGSGSWCPELRSTRLPPVRCSFGESERL